MRYWADLDADGTARCLVRIDVADGVEAHEPAFAAALGEAWTPGGWVPHPRAQESVTGWESDMAEIPAEHVERAQIDVLTNWLTSKAVMCEMTGRPTPPSVLVHRTFLITLRALDERVIESVDSTILRPEVVAALNELAAWDIAAEWEWMNTPVEERNSSPRLRAHLAAVQHCLALDDSVR
jgi:hypothetical protein